MRDTLGKIKQLVVSGEVRISAHGYDELINDGLTAREIVSGVAGPILVEDYPDFPKGACILVLQNDKSDQPVHVVWGIPKGHDSPAVLVTAYRPNPDRWSTTFMERRQ